jgi:hypothetical protein
MVFVRVLALVFLCNAVAFGQIEIVETKMQSIVGAVEPRIVGDRILVAADSKPKASVVSVIAVNSPEKVLRIVARKTLDEDVELEALTDGTYLLASQGKFRIECNTANHFRSIWVTVDSTPIDPVLPDPKPDELSQVSKESRAAIVGFVKSMAGDMDKLATKTKAGELKTVQEASVLNNNQDLASRAEFKANMAKIMQPKLGASALPADAATTFGDIANGFRSITNGK